MALFTVPFLSLVAGDAASDRSHRCATCAFAYRRPYETTITTRVLPFPGLDQFSTTAELNTLTLLLEAASSAGCSLTVLLDNLSVVCSTATSSVPSREPWLLCQRIRCRQLAQTHHIVHVPAHARNPTWQPPLHLDAFTCRSLNAAAHAAASSDLERYVHRVAGNYNSYGMCSYTVGISCFLSHGRCASTTCASLGRLFFTIAAASLSTLLFLSISGSRTLLGCR